MRRILTYITVIILFSCSGTRVVHFTNDDMPFEGYQHYRIVNFKADPTLSEKGKNMFMQLEKSIQLEMSKREYLEKKDGKPDLIVRYEVIANNQTDVQVNRNFNRTIFDPYFYDISQRDLTRSMLLIEILDVDKKKLVWQGSLDLQYSTRSKNKDLILPESVIEIFETFQQTANTK